MALDPFQENIEGVRDLVSSSINKTADGDLTTEGIEGEKIDILDLPEKDEYLLSLKREWEGLDAGYTPKIKPRQDKNKTYYAGRQLDKETTGSVVSSNLIFEAEETFIPQALAKNPEPVVWSDNTDEGKAASNDLKTMLQFHGDVLCLRRKLGVSVRHWSIYFVAILKHGWDSKTKDIKLDVRNPQNFVFDPDAYIDEFGNYIGRFLGERLKLTAADLIDMYPKHKDYIYVKVGGKLGTKIVATEWWTDEYTFTTFEDRVLDKSKNFLWNYGSEEVVGEDGQVATPAVKGINHFAAPKMPYSFLSVFSLQEHPHDITNLIEQNIPNQDRITSRDEQITKNLASGNNAIMLSGQAFTAETAAQARDSFYEEGFILIPNGDMNAVKRLAASPLPSGVLQAQAEDKNTLRTVFGTQGISALPSHGEDTTARGMILNQSHDASRIGGGIGESLEQLADNVFNWWTQLYYVFYDEPHYAAIMGAGRAVEYVELIMADQNRQFVVSVAPNSMQPKDEITEQNLAIDLANKGWLDPINLFKKLNYADPMETAKMVTLFRTNPQLYMMQFFPETGAAAGTNLPNNPPNLAPTGGGATPTLGASPASAALNSVPLETAAMPQ